MQLSLGRLSTCGGHKNGWSTVGLSTAAKRVSRPNTLDALQGRPVEGRVVAHAIIPWCVSLGDQGAEQLEAVLPTHVSL